MAKESRCLGGSADRKIATALHKDAKAVRKSAYRLVTAQARITSLGMDNIDIPMQEIHEKVVSLEVRLEWLIKDLVMEPINRPIVKRIAKQVAEQNRAEDAYMQEQEAEQHQQIRNSEPVFYGYCFYCDRSVGGWLGAGLGAVRTGGEAPVVTCNYCEGKDLTNAQRSKGLAKTLVREILNSGWCWTCKADIDEQIADHECDHPDCGYDAISVGQRRFCAECSDTGVAIPPTDLVEIARKVWDPTGTLDYFRLNA